MAETDQTGSNQEVGAQDGEKAFSLQRIYLKDMSFETPQGAKAFQKQWKPKVNQDLGTKINRLDDEHFEVVLNLTVTVADEDDTIYLAEVQQAGIFKVKGFEQQQLAGLLNTQCPQILFPYAREAIDGVVVRGSFPALMLPPVNFDALFQQALAQKAKEQEGEAEGQATH